MQAFILHLSSFLPRLVGETTRRLAANPLLKIGEKDHGNRDGLAGEELWALRQGCVFA